MSTPLNRRLAQPGVDPGRPGRVLRASPHFAEQIAGNRDFLTGTLDEVMSGRITVPTDQPIVQDFVHELRRHG